MGIKGLLPFLKGLGVPTELRPLQGRVAIDVPIFAHRFIYTARTFPALLARFRSFAHELEGRGLQPVFVFDGEKLALKDDERARRAEARNRQLDSLRRRANDAAVVLSSLGFELSEATAEPLLPIGLGPLDATADAGTVDENHAAAQERQAVAQTAELLFQGILFPTRGEYKKLEAYLREIGYETKTAKYEAEALCAHLTAEGYVEAVFTEDSDALAFGARRVVFRYGHSESYEMQLDDILRVLDMTQESFISLCAMLGCDFCENVKNIGPATTHKLVRKHGTWPQVYEACRYGWAPKTATSAIEFNQRWPDVYACFASRAYERPLGAEPAVVAGLAVAVAEGPPAAEPAAEPVEPADATQNADDDAMDLSD